MKKIATTSLRMTLRALGYGLFGGLVTLVATAVVLLERRPDLEIWHTVRLDAEFDRNCGIGDFAGYLEREERLFKQLDEEVYQHTGKAGEHSINRYQRGSMMDPSGWERDWNRTFEFTAPDPKAGVLLLHGMSDSPYSLRHLGGTLHDGGATVVGLRIPGHGTAPSGLVDTRWQDMAAAVRLAVRHLRESVGERPLFLVGYSNGGALAVEYALTALDDRSLPRVDGIVLLSPAIGVTRAAGLAVWQGRIGRWLGFDKLAWNSISLEYDPFKYGSFAINAGDQTYRITHEIAERLDKLAAAGRLDGFPPLLAFQSAVDATVSTEALVGNLFAKLRPGGHELVLFDVNRMESIEHVLSDDPKERLASMLSRGDLAFALSVVANRDDGGDAVVVRRRRAGSSEVETIDPGLRWPPGMYSLSHVALPFPESDPLYGSGGGGEVPTLGNLALRGERGAIRISGDDMLRQRWNPFYPLLERRVLEFTGLGGGAAN